MFPGMLTPPDRSRPLSCCGPAPTAVKSEAKSLPRSSSGTSVWMSASMFPATVFVEIRYLPVLLQFESAPDDFLLPRSQMRALPETLVRRTKRLQLSQRAR